MRQFYPARYGLRPPHHAYLLFFFLLALPAFAAAQNVVTGTVSDPDGIPLIGVSVYPNTNVGSGTVTDLDGQFTLTLPDGTESIIVSYIGFAQQTVPVGNQTKFKIRMKEDAAQLEEVVVIAYGEAKAEDIVGAVDQVTAKEIENLQVNSFDQALSGQVAGLQVRTGSGRPDGGAEILLRGVGTTGDNAPLIVIDGVPFGNYNAQQNNYLSLLNPNDIESISVVRDASGKALYGSRAANGLILITTKKGRAGKPTINFNLTSAIQTIPEYEKPNNLNATELATFLGERLLDDGTAATEADLPENFQNPERYGEGTDWFDLLTRTGYRHNADISVRGGTEQTTYNVSLGFVDNTGVIKETDFRRYSLRASVNSKITPWLTMNAILAPTQTVTNVAGTDPGTGQFSAYHALQIARWADPTAPAYDENGNLTTNTRGDLLPFWQANPLYLIENQQRTETNRRIQTQLQLTAEILPGLKLQNLAAANLIFNRGRRFRSGSILQSGSLTPALDNPDPQSRSSASVGQYENLRLYNELTLNYNKSFGQNNFDGIVGYVTELTEEIFNNAGGSRVINEDFPIFNSGNIARNTPGDPETTRVFFNASEGVSEQALISYFGRIQYNYDQRYYVTGNLRRDASSRFGPDLRAAYFPAGALAWRASKESWFPKTGVISNLRFEFSIGETGNNRLGNYTYQGNVGGTNYILGNAQAPGFTITGLPNPLLRWETSAQTDIGVELGLFKDRLKVEATYYRAETQDLLFSQRLPLVSGFGNIQSNIGDLLNKGIEFQIRTRPVVKDDFVWTFDANISANRNSIGQLGQDNTPIFTTQAGNGTLISRTFPGATVGAYYGLQLLGLYTQEMLDDPSVPRYPGAVPGAPFYVDGDGDGQLEGAQDYVELGDPFPDFIYGFTSFVTFKDFGLRIVGNGEQGALIYDLSREIELNTDGVFNVRRDVLDRWRPGDTGTELRVPTTVSGEASRRFRTPTSAGVLNGSYFRISNVTLSYRLNRLLDRVNGIKGATLSFAVQNALVFSPFYGNPQTGRASGALERNINYNTYPSVRTFTFGLNVNL